MVLDLTGRVALVTGATRGIGRAVAEGLARAGAAVAVHGTRPEAAAGVAASLPNGARPFAADFADPLQAQRLWDEVLAGMGRVDVLVNNAGLFEEAPLDAPLDGWLAAWERTMAVNLTSAAVLCRSACAHFAARRAAGERGVTGRIVNVASRAAFRGDDPPYLAYAASKAGLVALTRSIARGLGREGTAAFGVAPGYTRTDMAAPYIAQHGEAAALAGVALDRMTEPEDVAPLVVFLASGLADHATGTTVDVNAASYVR